MLIFNSLAARQAGCTCHIITRNDANTIIDCLESVVRPRLFSKILILIDTRSEDPTGRIINAYRVRYPEVQIVPYKWSDPPNFSAARNYCISLTPPGYAFWLDGDEMLKKPEQLRGMLARAQGQAFQMWVISPIGNGKYHNMYQPRLFPVGPGVGFECPVFERIDWSLARVGIHTELTGDDPIWHPGYTNPAILRRKNKRNVRIMKKYLRGHRRDDPQRQHIVAQYEKLKRAK